MSFYFIFLHVIWCKYVIPMIQEWQYLSEDGDRTSELLKAEKGN